MTILAVGLGKQFTTIPDAVAIAQSGDVIQVDAGDYVDQFTNINTNLTFQAVGGMVNMISDVSIPNGKAIFVTNGNVSIDGFSFTGAFVPDENGAGIRMETGDLTITNSYFHDNQEGILTAADPSAHLVISNTEFDHNGFPTGLAHNLYVGAINSVTITDSYFHDAIVGHEIKSRAANTTVLNSRIQDEGGSASYSIDAPNGGNVVIQGNVIQQGLFTENPAIIAVGEEGNVQANTSITVTNNTIINDDVRSIDLAVWNATSATAQINNNQFFGLTQSQIVSGLSTQSGNTFLTLEPTLDLSHPFGVVTPPPPPPPVGLILVGTSGKNVLTGGDGDDALYGMGGKDTIITGDGHDQVIFNTPLGKSNIDKIIDFSVNDVIVLDHNIFSNAGPVGPLSIDAFFIGSAAHDPTDRIIYNGNTGAVSYDLDGTGNGALKQFATIPSGLSLTSDNFKII